MIDNTQKKSKDLFITFLLLNRLKKSLIIKSTSIIKNFIPIKKVFFIQTIISCVPVLTFSTIITVGLFNFRCNFDLFVFHCGYFSVFVFTFVFFFISFRVHIINWDICFG